MKKKSLFTVIIEKDKDGYYAYCPQLQGCYTQGDTYEEALVNIEEAIRLHIENRIAEGESWKEPESIEVMSIEVKI